MKTKLNWLLVTLLLFLGALLVIAVGVVQAQSSQPVELQPSYILMDGEEPLGVVYGLDYGWLILTEDSAIYTCGCGEYDELLPYATPILPTNTPRTDPTPVPPTATPVVEPTPTPEEKKAKANCGLGNGPEGADPNENACGKNTGEENE